jgi:TetR/AcrR family transcriptional regulator, cholesterol catabolism regulator
MNNKQQNIIDTASVLFSRQGIKSTSLDTIAQQCGISKRTLYEYFPDKEMLLAEIVQHLLYRTEQYVRILPEVSPNAISEIISFFQYIESNVFVLTPMFIRDLDKYYPCVYDALSQARKNRFIPYLKQNIVRGIAEDIYRKNLDSDITGKLYFWQIKNAMDDASLKDTERYNLIGYLNDFFLHGIMNQNGIKLSATNFKK